LTDTLKKSEQRRGTKPSGGRERWRKEKMEARSRSRTQAPRDHLWNPILRSTIIIYGNKRSAFPDSPFQVSFQTRLSERCWVRLAVQRELLQKGARRPNTLTLEIQMQWTATGWYSEVCIGGYCIRWIPQNETQGWGVMGVWRSSSHHLPGSIWRNTLRNAKDLLWRPQIPTTR